MSTANLPQRFVGGALVAVMTLSTVGCKTAPPAQASADGAGSTTSSAPSRVPTDFTFSSLSIKSERRLTACASVAFRVTNAADASG